MKKYHRHTLLYLHETIDLGSGRSDDFTEVFVDTYQPMMEELGARLYSIWETTPYNNGHWPQVTIIWEIDAFADYARIGAAQARGGSHEAAVGTWSAYLTGVPTLASAGARRPPHRIASRISCYACVRRRRRRSHVAALPGRAATVVRGRARPTGESGRPAAGLDHLCGGRSVPRRGGGVRAHRLRNAGVPTELHLFSGACQGFDSLLPEWAGSQRLFGLQGAELGAAFRI